MIMLWIGFFLCYTMANVSGHPTTSYTEASEENEIPSVNFELVPRSEWSARTPKQVIPLTVPVPYVVIHHSYIPTACYDREKCNEAMRSMQDYHMDTHGWWDIGYNFAVGSDGVVYEGRGWTTLGAHALHFNTVSIGICLIGDWTGTLPPPVQMKTAKALISTGVELGYIKPHYKLVGHRQVRDTECPGQTLFEEIKSWNHWSPFPATHKDLANVPELIEINKIRDKLHVAIVKNKDDI